MELINNLYRDEQAAAMAEYALLLALIAVSAIGVLQVLGGQISSVFERTGDALPPVRSISLLSGSARFLCPCPARLLYNPAEIVQVPCNQLFI